MPQVFASIWPVDVFTWANDSMVVKVEKVRLRAEFAYENAMTAAATLNIKKPIVVFAMPEYYWLKGIATTNNGEQWTLYDETEWAQILVEMARLSKKTPRMLLVPGSIAWRKARQTPETRRNRVNTHDGVNSTPIFFGGKLHHLYDKKYNDGTCTNHTSDTVFRPGTGSQLFTVEGLKCGIEVCGDMDAGNLSAEAPAESLDLEIYISATNHHDFRKLVGMVPVRNGGYFIHCDATTVNGSGERNGVWALQRGSGWHGIVADAPDWMVVDDTYDPWTIQPVDKKHIDSVGLNYSRSSVLRIGGKNPMAEFPLPAPITVSSRLPKIETSIPVKLSTTAQTYSPPQQTDRSLSMRMRARPIAGVDHANHYQLRVRVEITKKPNSQALVSGHMVRFATTAGVLMPQHQTTGNDGVAETTALLPAGQKATITAWIDGIAQARVSMTSRIVTLGAGSVSRIGPLPQVKWPTMPTWALAFV